MAIDLLPEDAIAPPLGIYAIQTRYVGNRLEGIYENGSKVYATPKLSIDTFAIRLSTSFSLANRPSVFYVDAPYSRTESSGIPGVNSAGWGVGDTTFALAHWLLADRTQQHYAGVVGYLTLPTGHYNPNDTSNILGLNTNPGQNRWAAALQAGHFMRLGNEVGWLVAFDTLWFGENDDYRPLVYNGTEWTALRTTLNRRPLFTLQTHFSKRFDQRLMLGLGYYWVTGGESKVGDRYLGNALNTHRYQFTATYDLAGGYRVGAQYGGNLKTRNGFKETEQFSLRFWRFF
jgi:hypothetical protein